MSRIDRRRFLSGTCGLVPGAALSSCGVSGLDDDLVPGDSAASLVTQRWAVSACAQCPGGCGIRVRVAGEAAVGIVGLPSHPVNRGGLCGRGLAGLQVLYHPDRLRGPLRRTGPRGSGRYERISWDAALDELTERLRGLRAGGNPQSLALLTNAGRGQLGRLVERFARAYGTPNLTSRTRLDDPAALPLLLTQGVREPPAYDLASARYVLSFGSNWLEVRDPPEINQRAFALLRRGRPGRRSKIVEVAPRFSFTAAKADEWVPIRPGTQGALALAIAHVLVSEGRVDEEFVTERTAGYEDGGDESGYPRPGFKRIVLESYSPEWAEGITGVAAERIRRLARELAENRPAVVLGESGPAEHTNSLASGVAVHSLNALLGAVNAPGGVVIQRDPPYTELPPIVTDEVGRRGFAKARADGAEAAFPLAERADHLLPGAVLSGRPYPIEALLIHRVSPVHSHPASSGWREALEKVPFVASFNSFLDQSSRYADLVLPDQSYLETLADHPVAPSTGSAVVSLRSPVVAPLHDRRSTGDVLLELARRLGGTVAASFPWKGFSELVAQALEGLAGKGSLRGVEKERALAVLLETGFWSEDGPVPSSWDTAIRTPSRRFEFMTRVPRSSPASVGIRPVAVGSDPARGAQTEMLVALGFPEDGDRDFLFRYEPPRFAGDPETFPLHLLTYRNPAFDETAGTALPLLRESGSGFFDAKWSSRLEVNPMTARELGFEDRERVRVVSPEGSITVGLRTFPGVPPDAVALTLLEPGDWGARLLLANLFGKLTGAPATCGTGARVAGRAWWLVGWRTTSRTRAPSRGSGAVRSAGSSSSAI